MTNSCTYTLPVMMFYYCFIIMCGRLFMVICPRT